MYSGRTSTLNFYNVTVVSWPRMTADHTFR